MAYFYLAVAIVAEVIGTSSLKASEEFTRPGPSMMVVAAYGVSFYFLTLAFRTIPLGVAYAIWSGLGIALITLIGYVYFRQVLDAPAILGISLIVAGVAVIKLFSNVTVQ